MTIEFRIESDANDLLLRLDQLPRSVRRRVKAEIELLTKALLARVHAREPVRTGRLRRMTQSFVDENPAREFVRGRVRVLRRDSSLGGAAGALEYGSTGRPFPVRAYSRNGFRVRAHRRTGGIRERRFLRGAAAVILPRARAQLEKIVRDTMQQALRR